MRHAELVIDIKSSIIKWSLAKIAELRALHSDFNTLQFLDWDAHSSIPELPDTDLLGPAGIGITEDNGIYEIMMSIGFSSTKDPNLFRITRMASSVFADFLSEKQIPIFRSATAVSGQTPTTVGFIVFTSGTQLVPMSRAENRALQFVQARGFLDPATPSKL